MVSCFRDGAPLDKMMLNHGKRITRGNQTTLFFGPQQYMKATFTVDRTATPASIDYQNLEGPHAGQTTLGIFERSASHLKYSFASPGQPRPADFSASKGDGRTVTIWQLK
jgi:uncharacterized protein (TIGR03067 family)